MNYECEVCSKTINYIEDSKTQTFRCVECQDTLKDEIVMDRCKLCGVRFDIHYMVNGTYEITNPCKCNKCEG